jgi:biopolymer transport protein ExbD
LRKRREWITFDLTPLIDIVFLLLIFFMVFSVFKKDDFVLNIDLPSSKEAQIEDQHKNTTIELNNESLSFNGKEVTFDTLRDACSFVDTEELVVLSIDKNVRYEKIVHLLDILKEKRLENISLLVKK